MEDVGEMVDRYWTMKMLEHELSPEEEAKIQAEEDRFKFRQDIATKIEYESEDLKSTVKEIEEDDLDMESVLLRIEDTIESFAKIKNEIERGIV